MKRIKKSKKGYVLREGEATGHHHVITEDVELYQINDDELKLSTPKKVAVKHEEHETITLPKKDNLKVTGVVEYDPIEDEIRKVQD